jgi:hypothetical protein
MDTKSRTIAVRQLAFATLLATLAITGARIAPAAELIPSFGVTKSMDANASSAQGFGGLAIRASLFPFLKAEGGIAYRQDSFSDGDLKVRQWPVTVSAWVTPLPMVYAGGGLGWYRTTYDYRSDLPYEDSTTRVMGVHLGGGVEVPIATRMSLDVNGRYVFMQKDANNIQVPTSFNPDFWNLAVGLAIKL